MYYEVDLIVGDVEYNFDIDADTGSIVSWDQELTDRSLYGGQSGTNAGAGQNIITMSIMMITTGMMMTGTMIDFPHIYLHIYLKRSCRTK